MNQESGSVPVDDQTSRAEQADFGLQEFAEEAERRARAWRLLRILTLTVLGVGIAVVAWLLLSPVLWPNPDASVEVVNGRLIAEAVGYVARVDPAAPAVWVSQSMLGWRPVALDVTAETRIMVRQREGTLGDLVPGTPVRITYEIVGEQRRARSVAVGDRDTKGQPAADAEVRVPAAPAPTHVDEAPASAVAPPPAPPAPIIGGDAPRAVPTVSRPSLPPERSRPARPTAPVRASRNDGSASAPREARESVTADGTAAIDWLLEQSRHR